MEERVGTAPTALHPCVFLLRSVVPYKAGLHMRFLSNKSEQIVLLQECAIWYFNV